jgi:hypothetical protein
MKQYAVITSFHDQTNRANVIDRDTLDEAKNIAISIAQRDKDADVCIVTQIFYVYRDVKLVQGATRPLAVPQQET